MIDANCRLIADKVETLLKVLETQKKLNEHYKRDFSLDEVIIMAMDYLNNKIETQ